MADQGALPKLSGVGVPGLSGQASVDKAQPRTARTTAGQGVGRREVPDSGRRQLVNLDGKVLNRAAPRGTYLNILV